jgi:hypothetical protein
MHRMGTSREGPRTDGEHAKRAQPDDPGAIVSGRLPARRRVRRMRRAGDPQGTPWSEGERADARAERCGAYAARILREGAAQRDGEGRTPAENESRGFR